MPFAPSTRGEIDRGSRNINCWRVCLRHAGAECGSGEAFARRLQRESSYQRQVVREFYNLNARIQNLETGIVNKLEELAGPRSTSELFDFARQFRKLDTQMDSIRRAEGVNQRLFDSMHQELKEYRDNFLRDSLQKPYIRDLLLLFDDLTALSTQLKSAGKTDNKRSTFRQWSDNLENTIHALVEILHRLEVTEIPPQDKVDLKLHKVVSYEPAEFADDDGRIVMRVKRGFLWRDGVLRPEEVIAKRYG
jgi:molecular chaperone GrpE (heat shock protein)